LSLLNIYVTRNSHNSELASHPNDLSHLIGYTNWPHILMTYHTLSVTHTFSQCHSKGKAILVHAYRILGGCGSQISRQSAHEGGKVVSPTHRPPFPQETFLVLISARG